MMAFVGKDVKIGGFKLNWKIENFSCVESGWKCISSPIVLIEMLGNSQWLLQLNWGNKNDEEMTLTLSRLKNDNGPDGIYSDVKLFIQKNDYCLETKEEKGVNFGKNVSSQPLIVNKKTIFGGDYFLPGDTLVAGCQIIKCSNYDSIWLEYVACTRVAARKYDFRFPIHLPDGMGHHSSYIVPVYSPSIELPNFAIMFVATCLFGSPGVEISINMEESKSGLLTICNLSLEDVDGNVKHTFQGEHWFMPNVHDQTWYLGQPITISTLRLEGTLNPILIMILKLIVSDTTHISFIKKVNCSPSTREIVFRYFPASYLKRSATKSMRTMHRDKKFCDFTIRVQDDEFPVHKAVLGAVSPVFSAMFDVDMSEKNTSNLVIEDIDVDTVSKMLEFVYTDTCEILTWDSALKLFSAADKYQILHLKQYCSKYLQVNLSSENIWRILNYPSLQQDRLMMEAFHYFANENWKTIFRNEEWANVMKNHPQFACEIMHQVIMNSSAVRLE